MSEQFSDSERALIERLRRAPQLELSAEARDMIRVRMLDAVRNQPVPVMRPIYLRPIFVMVIIGLVGALIASGVLFALSQQNQNVLPTPTIEATITVIPTETVEPTATASPTNTAEPAVTMASETSVPLVISSPVQANASTSTPTIEATHSPTSLPSTAVNAVIVIQGPVEHIDGNILTIYGIPVQIDPDNPILKTIGVGDVIRIEGTQTGEPVIIISPTIIAVNAPPTANATAQSNANPPSSNQVWQDDGTCNHPPPDWAPANGWRRRCQGQTNDSTPNASNHSNNGNGNGAGNGNGDGNSGNNGNSGGNGNGKPNKP